MYNYHRWNAPIPGLITEAYLAPGTYCADVLSAGPDTPNVKLGAHLATVGKP